MAADQSAAHSIAAHCIDEEALRAHFGEAMLRRGANVSFDRFESASVLSDGIRLHLDVIEVAPRKPTIIFAPGTAVYGLTFANYLAALADQGFNVVSFDPRGHGRSEGERGAYTVPELVRDARCAIGYARERFGGPLFISGSSQGGIVAFYVAASNEQINGAICHNAADLADPNNVKLTDRPMLARLLKPVVAGVCALLPNAQIEIRQYFNLLSKGDTAIKDRLSADPGAIKVIKLRALASLASAPLERPVEAITTPVMMLHGAQDNIFPQALSEALFNRLTCTKAFKLYPGIGHFLLTDHVDFVIPDIVAWVTELS